MGIYRVTLEPYSAFRTPLQSDTIFGHLLWALRYQGGAEGQANLGAFLQRYRQGDPPLLASAGFPEGTLPVPILKAAPSPASTVANRAVSSLLDKTMAEIDYLPLAFWRELAGNLSPENLREARRQVRRRFQERRSEDYRLMGQKQAITRTAIDRVTGQARAGRLFVSEETFY